MSNTAATTLLTDDSYESLLQEVDRLAAAVRSSLRRCFDMTLLPGTGARGCGRALGLRRNLAWKAFAIAHSADLPSLLRALPGESGWALIIEAIEGTGRCEPAAIDDLKSAVQGLGDRISTERIDPAALRAIGSGSLESVSERRAMLRSRRAAFTAAKQIYGVHARARIGAFLVAPSREDGDPMIDLAALTIIDGIDRTRPGPSFPLYHRIRTHRSSVSGTWLGADLIPGDRAPLVPSLSSEGAFPEEIRLAAGGDERQQGFFEFVQRSPRRVGSLRAAFAECSRRVASPYVHGDDANAELRMPTPMPVETVVFDVLIHRDIPRGSEPAASMYGHAADLSRVTRWHENHRLPLEGDLSEIESLRLPQALIDVRETYASLLRLGAETIGHALSQFQAYRVVVPWPPMHASLLVTWRLAER